MGFYRYYAKIKEFNITVRRMIYVPNFKKQSCNVNSRTNSCLKVDHELNEEQNFEAEFEAELLQQQQTPINAVQIVETTLPPLTTGIDH